MDLRGTISDLFLIHKEELAGVCELARRIRETIRVIDPFIQQHTSMVCPGCRKVCCVDRHAHYECDDLIYLYALGQEPDERQHRAEHEPCQFLSVTGCRLDRTVRPSGCNWYLCGPLYDSMENTPGQAYADFDGSLQELADMWMKLGDEFRAKFLKLTGAGLVRPGNP